MNRIHILGKRWFDKQWGNTYHSVEVYVDGILVHRNPCEYGYDEQYRQTAWDWLEKNYPDLPPMLPYEYRRTWAERVGIVLTNEVWDVKRKRDL